MFYFIAKNLFLFIISVGFLCILFVCMCQAFPGTLFKFADWIAKAVDPLDGDMKVCVRCGYKGNEDLVRGTDIPDYGKTRKFFIVSGASWRIICSDCFYRGK